MVSRPGRVPRRVGEVRSGQRRAGRPHARPARRPPLALRRGDGGAHRQPPADHRPWCDKRGVPMPLPGPDGPGFRGVAKCRPPSRRPGSCGGRRRRPRGADERPRGRTAWAGTCAGHRVPFADGNRGAGMGGVRFRGRREHCMSAAGDN